MPRLRERWVSSGAAAALSRHIAQPCAYAGAAYRAANNANARNRDLTVSLSHKMEEDEDVDPQKAHRMPVPGANVGGDLPRLQRLREYSREARPPESQDASDQMQSMCSR
jgi:hypothetical protein